jgi:hypothetical protein
MEHGKQAASGGGPCYPPLAAAVLAPGRVNFAARLCGLLYSRKAGALACRTFELSRFCGLVFHAPRLASRQPSALPIGGCGFLATFRLLLSPPQEAAGLEIEYRLSEFDDTSAACLHRL